MVFWVWIMDQNQSCFLSTSSDHYFSVCRELTETSVQREQRGVFPPFCGNQVAFLIEVGVVNWKQQVQSNSTWVKRRRDAVLVQVQKLVPTWDQECKRCIGEKRERGRGGQKSHQPITWAVPSKEERRHTGWVERVLDQRHARKGLARQWSP